VLVPLVVESSATVAEAVAQLATRGLLHPPMVVGPPSPVLAVALLAAGARGYLLAGTPVTYARRLLDLEGPGQQVGRLSAREVQILQGLADGLSTGQVAGELGLSPLTIKSHMTRLTRRLGARNRVHAVLMALQAELIW